VSNRPEQQQNRRELCRDTLRYLAAGGIALFSAGLIVKGAGRSAKGRCAKSLACRDCAALAGCDLPAALSAKRATASTVSGRVRETHHSPSSLVRFTHPTDTASDEAVAHSQHSARR
jgi:hypothetical protein